MTQIINLVLFFKGLLFGNKKTGRASGGWKSFIITGVLIGSVALNYYMAQYTWTTAHNAAKIKTRLGDYEEIKAERDSLRITNKVLFEVLSTTGKLTKDQQEMIKTLIITPSAPAVPLPPKEPSPLDRQQPVLPQRDKQSDRASEDKANRSGIK